MHFEKTENLLLLAFRMQGSAEGVSLHDIEQMFGVKRRTAERMRDAIRRLFPQTEEVTHGRQKHWRIRANRAISSMPVSEGDLIVLSSAAKALRQESRNEEAQRLESIRTRLGALIQPDRKNIVGVHCEAMAQAEGLASRPGPRPSIDVDVINNLRTAVIDCWAVNLDYRGRWSGALSRNLTVHPYGFLFGHRHYLVAYNPYEHSQGVHLFALSNIEKVEVLKESFVRDENFDIDAYASNSFGVFQEAPYEVVWRVSPEMVDDAREYVFHPTQRFEDQDNGSLLIRFTAGGLLEMCWHLFSWGGEIQVLEPPELVDMLRKQMRRFKKALPKMAKPLNSPGGEEPVPGLP